MEQTPSSALSGGGNRRRAFFKRLLQALAGLWGAGFAAALLLYLKPPRRLGFSSAVEVGPLSELLPGQGRMVKGHHRPFWVVRLRDGDLVALPAVCTHRHCILKWEGEDQLTLSLIHI